MPGSLRDVEEGPHAVRLVQHPEHRKLLDAGVRAADRAIETRAARVAARPFGERFT